MSGGADWDDKGTLSELKARVRELEARVNRYASDERRDEKRIADLEHELAWLRSDYTAAHIRELEKQGAYQDRIATLERELDETRRLWGDCINEAGSYVRRLGELLAVIHRDGGHYTEKHGIDKSWADAMKLSGERLPEDEVKP